MDNLRDYGKGRHWKCRGRWGVRAEPPFFLIGRGCPQAPMSPGPSQEDEADEAPEKVFQASPRQDTCPLLLSAHLCSLLTGARMQVSGSVTAICTHILKTEERKNETTEETGFLNTLFHSAEPWTAGL